MTMMIMMGDISDHCFLSLHPSSFFLCFLSGFGSLGSCLEGPLVGFVSMYYGWGSVFYLMTGLSVLGALAVFRAAAVIARKRRMAAEMEVLVA